MAYPKPSFITNRTKTGINETKKYKMLIINRLDCSPFFLLFDTAQQVFGNGQ